MRSEHLFRIVLMALMLCAAFLLQSTAHAQVVVTELMWMGSDLSSADEWLELTSVTDQHTDIAGWSLVTVKDGQEETMLTFPAGSAVAPGACFIVSNYAADQSRLALDPDSVTSAVSLPNTQLKILLKDGSGSILDSVDDGAGTPFAGANPSGTGAKASMERIDPLAAGDDPANWRTSVQSCGFDDGAALFGSPGVLLCAPDDDSPPDIPDTGSGDTVPDPPPEEPDPDSGSGTTSEPLVLLSEILANPIGNDDQEWIELANYGSGSVNLRGWMLKRGTAQYTIAEDIELPAGAVIVLRKTQTGIALKNTGDTIELWYADVLRDRMEYPALAEEVSYGREQENRSTLAPFCVPTPNALNERIPLDPRVDIQSGSVRGEGKVTLNLQTVVQRGSLSGAECFWDFADGATSDKCNPASHTFDEPGFYSVALWVDDACGFSHQQGILVQVEEEESDEEEEETSSSSSSSSAKSSSSSSSSIALSSSSSSSSAPACVPTPGSGVILSEVMPNPQEGEEWIELFNLTDAPFILCGWQLDDVRDGGSHPWIVPEGVSIPAQGFLIIPKSQSHLALNNDTDDVWLSSPNGEYADGIIYAKIPKGSAYARGGGSVRQGDNRGGRTMAGRSTSPSDWCITNAPTPGSLNICPQEFSVDQQSSSSASSAKKFASAILSKPVLSVRYRNVLPVVSAAQEQDTPSSTGMLTLLSGALFTPFPDPLPPAIVKTGGSEEGAVTLFELIALVGGMGSSGGLLALRVLKGR